jgi:hypothetical protein
VKRKAEEKYISVKSTRKNLIIANSLLDKLNDICRVETKRLPGSDSVPAADYYRLGVLFPESAAPATIEPAVSCQ